MTRMAFAYLLPALILLAGCTTLSRGTTEIVYFNSTPIGAIFALDTGASCTAPCHVKLDRDQAVQITISKEGCQPQTATLVPQVSAAAGTWQTGQFDYDTGAVYDLLPNPLNVSLTCP
jgi:hypothetical protein